MSFQLASGMKALVPIVIPADATQQEKYASSELRNYLNLITTSVFPVKEAPVDGPQIAIGRAAYAFAPQDDALGDDGFAITSGDHYIAIQGGKRGVIYGVYELLEALGCRFFTSTCEKVPSLPELTAPVINTRQLPAFEYRDHDFSELLQKQRFAAKQRVNGSAAGVGEKFGGNMSYAWFVHSFINDLLKPDKYGDAHPEYYAMRDGKREPFMPTTQPCLTNPEIIPILVEETRQMLLAHPEARIISISQNDGAWSCQCDKCRAADEEEGSPAGPLLRVVNAVAEALEPEFPDVIFDTLAYVYTRAVPKVTHPRRNVCVRMCTYTNCTSHPLDCCDHDFSGKPILPDLRAWGAWHDRIYIWDYVTNFSHYPMPLPNWRTLQPNMQTFANNSVKGMFAEANRSAGGGVDLNELRAYMLCKLMWNPWCDIEQHKREFIDEYYGDAAPYINEYIDYLCDKAENENVHFGIYNNPDMDFFCDETLDTLSAIVDKAKSAVTGDPMRLWRVGKLELSVRFTRMKRHAHVDGKIDPTEMNKFFTDWKAYGLSRIHEWVCAESSHRAILEGEWRGTEHYPHWTFEGPEEF